MASRKIVKGILELINFSTKVKFYTKEKEAEFNHLNDFIELKSENDKGFMIFLTEEQYTVIRSYLKEIKIEISSIKIGGEKGKEIGFTIGSYKKRKVFYPMKYKIGTDEFNLNKKEDREAALNFIENAPSKAQSGYTSYLRKIISTDEKYMSLNILYKPSLSPLIFAKCGREFENVKCRDFCSFYPYLLTQELPHFKRYIKKEEIDFNDKTKTYYGGLRIYNIKAKTTFYSLSLIGENNETEIAAGQGIGIVNIGTRLISADRVVIFGWLPFLIEELYDYDFDYVEITNEVAEYELKIDQKLRVIVLENFEKKQAKKRNGEPYKAEKVMLNRYYGFFITKENKSAPAHYGQFIVAKGKAILRRIALQIGLEDIVQGHTDSIKFVGDHQDVINNYNATIEFEELGKLADEGTMEKVIYYNTNRAKYLMNGKVGLKHGGIADSDLTEIAEMDYEEIDFKTEYNKALKHIYDEEYGFYPLVKVKKFGGSLK